MQQVPDGPHCAQEARAPLRMPPWPQPAETCCWKVPTQLNVILNLLMLNVCLHGLNGGLPAVLLPAPPYPPAPTTTTTQHHTRNSCASSSSCSIATDSHSLPKHATICQARNSPHCYLTLAAHEPHALPDLTTIDLPKIPLL